VIRLDLSVAFPSHILPAMLPTLNPLVPPFVPRTPVVRPNAPMPPISTPVNKKRLRAQRLFPLCLKFAVLNNAQKAALRIRRKAVVKRMRQLKLLREIHDGITQMNDTLARSQALFCDISMSIHSISVAAPVDESHSANRKETTRVAYASSFHLLALHVLVPLSNDPSKPLPSYQDQG